MRAFGLRFAGANLTSPVRYGIFGGREASVRNKTNGLLLRRKKIGSPIFSLFSNLSAVKEARSSLDLELNFTLC
jgi:hypothetical protein